MRHPIPAVTPRIAACATALALASVLLAPGCGAPAAPEAEAREAAAQRHLEEKFAEAVQDRAERPRLSPEDALRAEMAAYERKYEANPRAPDAAAYLMAIGNLAQSHFGDDTEAIRCYELIVLHHADWAGASGVYPLLAAAYERTGRQDDLRWIYQRMAAVFPPHTPEHQYAQHALGLEPTPIPPDPDAALEEAASDAPPPDAPAEEPTPGVADSGAS